MISNIIILIAIVLIFGIVPIVVVGLTSNSKAPGSEREARRRGFLAWLLTDSALLGWLVYRNNKPKL